MSKMYYAIVKTETNWEYHTSADRAEVAARDAFAVSVPVDDPRAEECLEEWDREVAFYKMKRVGLTGWGKLNRAERNALARYAVRRGRQWRSILCDAWACGEEDSQALRSIRNKIGPRGLELITMTRLKDHADFIKVA